MLRSWNACALTSTSSCPSPGLRAAQAPQESLRKSPDSPKDPASSEGSWALTGCPLGARRARTATRRAAQAHPASPAALAWRRPAGPPQARPDPARPARLGRITGGPSGVRGSGAWLRGGLGDAATALPSPLAAAWSNSCTRSSCRRRCSRWRRSKSRRALWSSCRCSREMRWSSARRCSIGLLPEVGPGGGATGNEGPDVGPEGRQGPGSCRGSPRRAAACSALPALRPYYHIISYHITSYYIRS